MSSVLATLVCPRGLLHTRRAPQLCRTATLAPLGASGQGGLLTRSCSARTVAACKPATSNLLTWSWFATAINLHVTGMLDIYLHNGAPQVLRDLKPETVRAAQRNFLSKLARYYAREYVLFPLLAGPFFWKVLLGNVLSEVARDVYAAATVYCTCRGQRPIGGSRTEHRRAPQMTTRQTQTRRATRRARNAVRQAAPRVSSDR